MRAVKTLSQIRNPVFLSQINVVAGGKSFDPNISRPSSSCFCVVYLLWTWCVKALTNSAPQHKTDYFTTTSCRLPRSVFIPNIFTGFWLLKQASWKILQSKPVKVFSTKVIKCPTDKLFYQKWSSQDNFIYTAVSRHWTYTIVLDHIIIKLLYIYLHKSCCVFANLYSIITNTSILAYLGLFSFGSSLFTSLLLQEYHPLKILI